jgi:hypothetical protein
MFQNPEFVRQMTNPENMQAVKMTNDILLWGYVPFTACVRQMMQMQQNMGGAPGMGMGMPGMPDMGWVQTISFPILRYRVDTWNCCWRFVGSLRCLVHPQLPLLLHQVRLRRGRLAQPPST